jgi:hypothetical protein
MNNLSKLGKTTRVTNGATASTGTSNGSFVDMKGYQSVTFYVLLGSIASGSPLGAVTVKAQQSAGESPMVWADLEGTLITYTNTSDNKVAIIEIDSPGDRYVRPVVTRSGGTSVIDGIIAVQTKAYAEPVTHDTSTVVSSEYHLSPAEGTA